MREKLLSLPLTQLKEIAKAGGVKGITGLKKEELVDLLIAEDARRKAAEAEKAAAEKATEAEKDAAEKVAAEKAVANKAAADKVAAKKATAEKNGIEKAEPIKNTGVSSETTQTAENENRPERKAGSRPRTSNRTAPKKAEAIVEALGENQNSSGETRNRRKGIVVYRGDKPSPTATIEVVDYPGTSAQRQDNQSSQQPQQTNAQPGTQAGAQAQQQSSGTAQTSQNASSVGAVTPAFTYIPSTAVNKPTSLLDAQYTPQEGDEAVTGILEVMAEGYAFIRSDNYLPGDHDVYVAPNFIRTFKLRTGDVITGIKKAKGEKEKFSPLSFLEKINGRPARENIKRVNFENLTPIFPNRRIKLETPGCSVAMKAMDLVSPVGKGQRGMIVSPPKAGKTTLLKEIAHSMLKNDPLTHILILLIDERPEEVTDIKEAIIGQNVEVIYSTFDEQPEHHMRVSEMVIERARRLVEMKEDVVILLDSITRLTRAYNQVIPPSGRTLSGGLDPAALHMPKRFFGAARNMREGGSLTILATALVETGSKMDDVVYEEFKGTGNMEIVLDRKLSEKRIFPAIDLAKSGTRREDLLLSSEELEAINIMRKALNGLKPDEATDRILDMLSKTKNNFEFVQLVKKNKFL